MSMINRESTTAAPAPSVSDEERKFMLKAIEKSGAIIVAKMIFDLYCLENTRSMFTRKPRVEIDQWVIDPRFDGQIRPYGFKEIRRLVMQFVDGSVNNPE